MTTQNWLKNNSDQIINEISVLVVSKERERKKEKLYEGMGISFQVISNIILSFCAFSTWKMAFSKLDRGINKWIAHMSKDDQKQGAHDLETIFIHTTKPLPFLAGQPHPSFLE